MSVPFSTSCPGAITSRAPTKACVLGVVSRKPAGGVVCGAANAHVARKKTLETATRKCRHGSKQHMGSPSFAIRRRGHATTSLPQRYLIAEAKASEWQAG